MINIDRVIDEVMLRRDQQKRDEHKSSGKLSAGMLAWPIQWSVLKLLGVKDENPDAFLLRKFARGNQAEDWLVDVLSEEYNDNLKTQVPVEYKGVVGIVDAVIRETEGEFPHEIKSVTNIKFKRITQGYKTKNVPPSGPQKSHALQACLYALAMGTDIAYLHYVASDDLRVQSYVIRVADYQAEIERTIEDVATAMRVGHIPSFAAREEWNAIPDYAKYLEWMPLSPEQAMEKLEREPHATT